MADSAPAKTEMFARPGPLQRALLGFLAWRHMPLAAAGLSLVLCSPALLAGLIADDFIHQLILRGADALPAYKQHWSALFAFVTRDNGAALMEEGVLPWWADPELRFAFFRPISALTHLLDARLWPDLPWLMHLHSFAWSVLSLLAVHALYARVFAQSEPSADAAQPRLLARLGLLFFALDPTRAVAVGWIANRNTLVSLTFSIAAVCVHLDGFVAPRLGRRLLSPCLLALGVLAGEGGVSGLAFLIAAAVVLDPRGFARGLLAVLPHLAAAGCMVALGSALGYGVSGSDGYLDPRQDLIGYVCAFPARALALFTASMSGPAADATAIYDLVVPGLATVMKLVSLALMSLLVFALAPLISHSRSARFFGLALCLALPPACVAFAADRLLTWIGVAAAALLAECAAFALQPARAASQPRPLRLAAAAVLGARVLIAPLLLFAQAQNLQQLGELIGRAAAVIPSDPNITQRVAVFVNAPEEPLVSFVLPQRAASSVPRPRALRRWAAGFSDVAITRVAAARVEVVQDGGFLRQHTERMVRSPRTRPFRAGDRVVLSDMEAEVMEVTDDDRPQRVAFNFDPRQHLFYALTREGYRPFELPAIGTCVQLRTPSFLEFVLGEGNFVSQMFSPVPAQELCAVRELQ